VNGFVGNSWRIQMIQSLKAWATRPENAKSFRELKIVSTGTDVAAQIAAIDNLIAAGYDGIIFIAVSPTAFINGVEGEQRRKDCRIAWRPKNLQPVRAAFKGTPSGDRPT